MSLFFANHFHEPLSPTDLPTLTQMIRDPLHELADRTSSLRSVRSLDDLAFQKAKARLPFYIGASFRDHLRKTTHFESIHWFTLDLDGIISEQQSESSIKQTLKQDPRIALAYLSPSGSGIKVLFQLSAPVTHTKAFSEGYQRFGRQWAADHGWSGFIDLKTHDVTRVSFLCHDPNPVYTPTPEPVDASSFQVMLLPWEEEQTTPRTPALPESEPTQDPQEKSKKDMTDEVFQEIRKKLGPEHRPPKSTNTGPYVPEELRSMATVIRSAAAEAGLQVEFEDIQYGLRVKVHIDHHWAQLNLFYGKQGFSIVPTPKKGSNGELAALLYELVNLVIHQQPDLEVFRRKIIESGLNLN